MYTIYTSQKGDIIKKVILLILFMTLSKLALAGGFKTEQELRPFADKFMDQIIDSKFQEALNSAKPYWPLPPCRNRRNGELN